MKTCLLFIALLNSCYCFGQYERVWPTTDIQKCEGDTFIIRDNIGIYNKIKTSYDENCTRRNEYNEANLEEFVVEGIEVIERNTTKYFCGETCSYEQGFLIKRAKGCHSPTFVVTRLQNHDYYPLPG